MPDVCDLRNMMRSFFFPRDRDISLQPNRSIYLGSTNSFIYSYDGVSILLPGGNIVLMFSGAIGDIPSGWQLADGTNGTTDLRGMFVVGAGGSYSVGDTGGSDTVDISHTHTDTFSVDSDSHSHADTLSVDSDSHSHNSGTLSTDNDGHSHTMPGASVVIGNEAAHTHGPGSFNPTGSTVGAGLDNLDGSNVWLTSRSHTHTITGTSDAGSSHTHTITGTTATHNHTHDVTTGSTASDSHSHTMSGSVSSDSHSHVLSGSVSTGGDTTHDNRPAFYALCFIMRPV
jgi:hypothetical protein